MTILNLTLDEIDLLATAAYALDSGPELRALAARLEAACSPRTVPVVSAWEVEVKSEKGHAKHWYRVVEVRLHQELDYVFRARAGDILKHDDPIVDHCVVVGGREYRSTEPAPAEVHMRAVLAFRGVQCWLRDCGLTGESLKQGWTMKQTQFLCCPCGDTFAEDRSAEHLEHLAHDETFSPAPEPVEEATERRAKEPSEE